MQNHQPLALTDKQSRFVTNLLAGMPQTLAAQLAGYAFPAVDGCRAMHSPAVIARLADGTREIIFAHGPAAVRTVVDLLDNADPRVRLKAGELIMKAVGVMRPDASKAGERDKPLSEMTGDELRVLARRMREERETADKKAVDTSQETQQTDIETSDSLGLS